MPPILEVRLLGSPSVFCQGEPILERISKKGLALLAYMVAGPASMYRREELAGLLWGEIDESRAHYNLRRVLWSLRREINPGDAPHDIYLRFDNDFYSFDKSSDYWLDVAEFDQTLEKSAVSSSMGLYPDANPVLLPDEVALLERAVELNTGDFMAGFRLPGCPEFEDWMFLERDRLRLRGMRVLSSLARHALDHQDYPRAIRYSKRIIEIDPTNEAAHRDLMSVYFLTGNREAALQQYQLLRRTLENQLGLEPLAETLNLYEVIRTGVTPRVGSLAHAEEQVPAPRSSSALLSFVGRAREQDILWGAVEAARAGSGSVFAITGEAGIGKTRLIEEVLARGAKSGVQVIQANCYGEEGDLPYQPMIDAFRSLLATIDVVHLTRLNSLWLSEIIRLLPELGSYLPHVPESPMIFPEQERNRLFEGVAQFITHLTQRKSLVLFLDDIHFADKQTLEMIHYLGRRLTRARVLLVIAYQTPAIADENKLQDLLWSLKRAGCLTTVALEKLSEQDTSLLVREVLDGQADLNQMTHLLYEESGGNPFFLIELLHAIQEENQVGWTKFPIPNSIRDVIERRLLRLDGEYQRLLNTAAIIGRRFDANILELIYTGQESHVPDILARLANRHWVKPLPGSPADQYDFAHGLVRQVIYQLMTEDQRRRLHQQIGLALEENKVIEGELTGVLAHHFGEAGDLARALRYSLLAAEYSHKLHAYREVKGFYLRALQAAESGAAPLSPNRYAVIVLELGRVQQLIGEYEAAIQTYQLVLTPEAMNSETAAAILADPINRQLCLQLALTYDRKGEYQQAIANLRLLEYHIPELDDPESIQERATVAWGAARVHMHREQNNVALALCNQALALLDRLVWSDDLGRVRVTVFDTMAQCYFNLGNYEIAVQHYESALEIARRLNQLAIVPRLLTGLGNIARRWGHYDQAEGYALESLAICQQIGLVAEVAASHGTLGNVAYNRGKLDDALHSYEQALDIYRQLGELHGIADYCISLAFVLLDQDEVEEAEGYLREAYQIGRSIDSDLIQIRSQYHLAKVDRARDNLKDATSKVKSAIKTAETAEIELMQALGYRLLGEIFAQQKQANLAEHHILEGLQLLEKLGERFEVAWTLRSYARLLAARLEATRALALYRQAVSIFTELGAERELAITKEELNRLEKSE